MKECILFETDYTDYLSLGDMVTRNCSKGNSVASYHQNLIQPFFGNNYHINTGKQAFQSDMKDCIGHIILFLRLRPLSAIKSNT